MSIRTVAVVAYNHINPFLLSVPCMVFGGANSVSEAPRFNLLTCSGEGRTLQSSAGFAIQVEQGLESLEAADILVLPGWRDAEELPPGPLLQGVKAAHKRGALVVGLCLGSYILAAAGLLENRPATTHWSWADDLARRYPAVRLMPDVLYVDDGDLVTSAGVAAGIDCCLHILRRFHGAKIANRVARRMVVPPHRQGGQSQYIEQPLSRGAATDHFSALLEWLQANLDQPHSIDSLAERLAMSRRTFTRSFRRVTGTTVGAWLLNQRLGLAQRLLENGSASLELIAQQAGFGSAVSLRQHFVAAFSTTPSRYRREFRGG